MNPAAIFMGMVVSGVVAAIVWVAFWAVLVPEISNGWVWAGHEALNVPVFFFGFFAPLAAPVLGLFSGR